MSTEADWAAVWTLFEVDDPGVNVSDDVWWIVRGVADHAKREGDDDTYLWTRALAWLAAGDLPNFEGPGREQLCEPELAVRDALLAVANQMVNAAALRSDDMLRYGDVHAVDRAYQQLGVALEDWKAILAEEKGH